MRWRAGIDPIVVGAVLAMACGLTQGSSPGAPAASKFIVRYTPIDLSRWLTHRLNQPMMQRPGNDLATLRGGSIDFGRVPFAVSGIVLVRPGRRINGIRIGRMADALYFVQGNNFSAAPGRKIGEYIVHYSDGSSAIVPIRYGIDVLDWWSSPAPISPAMRQQLVWVGTNDAASARGVHLRLFMKTWKNPRPKKTIATIDMAAEDIFSDSDGNWAPFLIGLTAEARSANGTSDRTSSTSKPRSHFPSRLTAVGRRPTARPLKKPLKGG